MELRKGYKQTEVGLIPDDWSVKSLGDCLIARPKYGIGAAAVGFDDTLPTYLRITDISEDGNYLSNDKVSVNHPMSTLYYLEEGDIVFARTGASVGKTYHYESKDGKLVFAGFLICVKPDPKILHSYYLKYLTQTKSYWSWVLSNSMRSGQPGVNSQQLETIPIPLPPSKSEQTAIATALSDADALITSLEKLIAKKRNIKQGAMQHLLKPKKGWRKMTYGDVFEFLSTANYSRAEINQGGTAKYIHYGDIHTKWDSFVDVGNSNLPTVTDEQLRGYHVIQEGDVVMADASEDYAGVGKSVEVVNLNGDQIISGLHTFLLRDKAKTFISGFRGYIHSIKSVKFQLDRLATGLKVYGISKSNLRTVLIPVPSQEEQTLIAQTLRDMDAEIAKIEGKLVKLKSIKQGMMQNLLTGKIRLV